ncbi:MAG: hypothetical protein NTY04_00105, partial [Candidatus Staskawiczbacteria bacterium]|nr:hypothetical protein [Candidatus Staskawiczbacteria bacterium]
MSLSSVTLLDGSVVRPGDMVKLMSEDMVKEILRKKHKKLHLGDYNLQYDWLEYYYYSIDWI